jgi:galactose-1-phosphate uridylyltransferase
VTEGRCDFRRIANLFEIIPYDYWALNLGFQPSRDRQAWRDEYLADEIGRRHIETLLRSKLKNAGWDSTRLSGLSSMDIRKYSESFFFGSHDLLVASRHYKPNAKMDTDIQSAGDLDPDAHYHYLLAASETACDILAHNPLARYATIFQNWLSPAGASFEHLHKQILGSHRPGPYPEALEKVSAEDPLFFNHRFLGPALDQKWLIASNSHAVAVAAFGIAYPALWVFSKSRQSRPWELSTEALKGFSDILHACHAATGSNIPSNEEWVYRPPNSTSPIPFHVTLKWRVNIHAGYEGASGIAISPMGPGELQKHLVDRMKALQSEGQLGSLDVAPNCADDLLPGLEL